MARFQSCNTHMVSIHPYGEARTENATFPFRLFINLRLISRIQMKGS